MLNGDTRELFVFQVASNPVATHFFLKKMHVHKLATRSGFTKAYLSLPLGGGITLLLARRPKLSNVWVGNQEVSVQLLFFFFTYTHLRSLSESMHIVGNKSSIKMLKLTVWTDFGHSLDLVLTDQIKGEPMFVPLENTLDFSIAMLFCTHEVIIISSSWYCGLIYAQLSLNVLMHLKLKYPNYFRFFYKMKPIPFLTYRLFQFILWEL